MSEESESLNEKEDNTAQCEDNKFIDEERPISTYSSKGIWFCIRFVILDLLLLLLAVSGFGGGYSFITDPTGGSMQIPPSYLEKVSKIGLSSWFIPGCFLMGQFCVLPCLTFIILFRNRTMGVILCYHIALLLFAWITVQVSNLGWCLPSMQIGCLVVGFLIGVFGYSIRK